MPRDLAALLLGLALGVGTALIVEALLSGPLPAARPRRARRLRAALDAAGLRGVPASAFVVADGALAAAAGAAAFVLTGVPVLGALALGAGAGAPWLALGYRRAARARQLRGQWPEAIDHIASGVRAGLSLPEALAHLAERGPVGLRAGFGLFAARYHRDAAFGPALDAAQAYFADPHADRVFHTLRLTREVGSTDTGTVLRTLADFIRADEATRGELEARQSWTVAGARLALAAPWLVLALFANRPETAAAYRTPLGTGVILAGLALTVLAYLAMRRIGRLPREQRVLGEAAP